MGKYSDSSDSEYEKKSRHRAKNLSPLRHVISSSEGSNSSGSNAQSKHHHSRRTSSHLRRSRSSSRNRQSRRQHNDRRRRSRSPKRSSSSNNRRRRSRSKSYIREYTSKRRHSTSSTSSSNSSSATSKRKEKAKGNARKEKLSSIRSKFGSKSVEGNRSDDVRMPDLKDIEEINSEKFEAKKFTSSRSSKQEEKIVIDLHKQTIKVPERSAESIEEENNSIFHHGLFLSEEQRMEKWIKDLYMFRQKALQQGAKKSL